MKSMCRFARLKTRVDGSDCERTWTDDATKEVAEVAALIHVREKFGLDHETLNARVVDVDAAYARWTYTVLITSPSECRVGRAQKVWGEFQVEVWRDYSLYPEIYRYAQRRVETLRAYGVTWEQISDVAQCQKPSRFRERLLRRVRWRLNHKRWLLAVLGLPPDMKLLELTEQEFADLPVPPLAYWTYVPGHKADWGDEYNYRTKRFCKSKVTQKST